MKHDGNDNKTGRPEFLIEDDPTAMETFLGDSPTARVWGTLWEYRNSEIDWTKKDLAEGSGISRPALYKCWDMFIHHEFIIPSKKIKGKQHYKLNDNHPIINSLMDTLSLFLEYNIGIMFATEEAKNEFALKYKKKKSKKVKKNAVGRSRKKVRKKTSRQDGEIKVATGNNSVNGERRKG